MTKKLLPKAFLALSLFMASVGVGRAFQPSPAEAAKPAACRACIGERCVRTSFGSQSCYWTQDGVCVDFGECAEF
jgi:hypothetical protein